MRGDAASAARRRVRRIVAMVVRSIECAEAATWTAQTEAAIAGGVLRAVWVGEVGNAEQYLPWIWRWGWYPGDHELSVFCWPLPAVSTLTEKYTYYSVFEAALCEQDQRLANEFCNRGKITGTAAFFSCADSSPWTLCIMCRRRPPFPR